MKLAFVVGVFSFFSIGVLWSQPSNEIKSILNSISPDKIKGVMRFLSDDLLEGRGPGTRGFALASKYMESQFIALGLKPVVGDTSYIQEVPLLKAWPEEQGSQLMLIDKSKDKQQLEYGKEFFLNPYFPAPHTEVEAPLVFVGFGISAPEFKHDDYAGIDAKGKIVVYLSGAPAQFPNSERAYYTSADAKYSEAVKHGAVGAIQILGNSTTPSAWDARVRRSRSGSYKWSRPDGTTGEKYGQLKAVATFNPLYAPMLFVNAKTTIEQVFNLAAAGKSESFDLKLSAAIRVKSGFATTASSNVLGLIPGSDPGLKYEYIVYSAHLDHLGIGRPVKGDSIYNGAHDDASGNAILLEIARAFRALKIPSKRSVIIASVTGEELGLIGSDYFMNNLPLKSGKVVANLAIDMPFFFHPVLDIVPYGAEHSSLGEETTRATKELGLKISPDPIPEQVVFTRSDHYSFVKKGIPALFIKSGFMTVPADTVDRAKSDVAWRNTIYHSPQDDMSQPFDFNAAAMHAKVNFLIGYYVSMSPKAPTWKKGDFFGRKFGPQLK